jgi:hypothetical protein
MKKVKMDMEAKQYFSYFSRQDIHMIENSPSQFFCCILWNAVGLNINESHNRKKKYIYPSSFVVVAKSVAENSLEVRQTRLNLDSNRFFRFFQPI